MRFIIDSSTLIEIGDYYPKDIFPTLWEEIFKLFEDGTLFSIKEVYEELMDSKKLWKDYEDYFRELTENEYNEINGILSNKKFIEFKNHGLDAGSLWADPYLIACAKTNNDVTIVTQENLNHNPKRKIPYVCIELNIPCINFFSFLRQIKIKI